MNNNANITEIELITVIVNFGLGSKILKTAAQNGIPKGTVFLGKGTMINRITEFFGLNEIRKEIVLMASSKAVAENVVEVIDKEFHLKKPNHGIAFTTSLSALLAAGRHDYIYNTPEGEENKAMYTLIIVIVDKGKAELVMDAAVDAGARGGTIINARGSGQYQTGKLFHIDIEPEKEMVMILAETSGTEKIADSVRDQLEIDKDGNGIILCQDVNKVYGIY